MPAHINIFIKKEKKKEHNPMTRKKKKKQWSDVQYILNKPKGIVAFTDLHNNCYNIFTNYLFLVVVGHSFIFYYFISTCKKWTLQ